ncbi:MAG: hypothetical protein KDN18_14790 [Verrucomicrobiae bacterium]|nr:hypothetical protein [Verrucomicrobiae bacterium]
MNRCPAFCLLSALPFLVSALPASKLRAGETLEVGKRWELFATGDLVEEPSGDLSWQVHQPRPGDVVFSADAPWEGNTSGYYTVFQDGPIYRLYYRGWAHDPQTKRQLRSEVTCYVESDDGRYWRRPDLGLLEFAGSKRNNLILSSGNGVHNFTPFRDENPACPPEARYKALGGSREKGKHGLMAFHSADGIHWEQAGKDPVITAGAFDSQNLAFWDSHRGEYRAYWRIFTKGVADGQAWKPEGFRAIRTATSKDFVHWEPHEDLTYTGGVPDQHLYTNAVQPYFRAPHLFVGFPTRFLPEEGERVEPVFMISRDGVRFRRFAEPLILETAPADRQGNRSNYMTWGLVQLPGRPDEMTVYATEAYYGEEPGRIRAFTWRLDGFVSLRAGEKGGESLSRPLLFSGKELVLNYAVGSPRGSVRAGLLDENGAPIPGYSLDESIALTGDSLEGAISWPKGGDLSGLAGKPVRVVFRLVEADLYAMRFR